MKEKFIHCLRLTSNSVILAGILLCLMGFYYAMIKAGIPYQDPTPELQMQYAIHMGIGEILQKNGFLTVLCGGVVRLVLAVKRKKKSC